MTGKDKEGRPVQGHGCCKVGQRWRLVSLDPAREPQEAEEVERVVLL